MRSRGDRIIPVMPGLIPNRVTAYNSSGSRSHGWKEYAGKVELHIQPIPGRGRGISVAMDIHASHSRAFRRN